jgi:hypothetical protein
MFKLRSRRSRPEPLSSSLARGRRRLLDSLVQTAPRDLPTLAERAPLPPGDGPVR